MKYIGCYTKEIGWVHEDGFKAFLEENNIDFKLMEKEDYTFFEYHKKNGQRVLVVVDSFSGVDELFERRYLFELEEREQCTREYLVKIIEEIKDR